MTDLDPSEQYRRALDEFDGKLCHSLAEDAYNQVFRSGTLPFVYRWIGEYNAQDRILTSV